MKKNIKAILILIILLLILLGGLIIFMKYNKSNNNQNDNSTNTSSATTNSTDNDTTQTVLYTDTSSKRISSTAILLAIQDTINTYYSYNYSNNVAAIMGILDESYVEANKISQNNIYQYLKKENQNLKFFCIDAYEKEISFDHEYKYWVYGITYSDDYKTSETNFFEVNLDQYNSTFKLIPHGKVSMEEYKNYVQEVLKNDKGGNVEVSASETTEIKSNEYNAFKVKEYNELIKSTIENYLNYYYYLQQTDKQSAYNLLNKEYREARFGDVNNYYQYLQNNHSREISYIKEYTEGSTNKFIAVNKFGDYYIFVETAPMTFSIMLDSYTIPLTETQTKYSSATKEQKACMCLEQVKEMLNNKDYNAIYNHLNSTFKNNNFEMQDKLESYLKNKFYNTNNFKYESYQASNDSYVINVKVSDSTDETKNFDMSFVVELADSINNFEMSFNIN